MEHEAGNEQEPGVDGEIVAQRSAAASASAATARPAHERASAAPINGGGSGAEQHRRRASDPSDVPETLSFVSRSRRREIAHDREDGDHASGHGLQRADGRREHRSARPRAQSASTCSNSDAATRLTRLEFERGGRRGSHRPVSSATEAVYFKCVQSSLDNSQGPAAKLRYRVCRNENGEIRCNESPRNDRTDDQPDAAVVHENSFSRAKTRGVGRFMHDGSNPIPNPTRGRLPAAV